MKGTPDRRRISSQILVINCQSDAAGADIVRIRWMYSQFSAAGPDGTQIFSATTGVFRP